MQKESLKLRDKDLCARGNGINVNLCKIKYRRAVIKLHILKVLQELKYITET